MSKLEFNPEWVKAARRGDQEAVSMLYSSTYSSVYYTIRSLVRYDEDTVMDLLQDTYVKAFTKLDSLGADDKFPAWVKTIARNTALNYLDKKKPLLFTETEDDEGNATWEPVDTDMSRIPEEVLDQADTEQIFKEILDSIPEKQRIVISMYYYMEIKQADIARILGLSIGAVNTRLKLGVKSIEDKILAIEKRDGIRLHTIAPFTFFLLLLKKADAKAMEPDMEILAHVTDAINNESSSSYNAEGNGSPSSGETGPDTGISSSAGKAVKAAGSTGTKGIVAKVIGGIAIVAVVGSGSAYVSSNIRSDNELTAETETGSQSEGNPADSEFQAAYEAYAEIYTEIENEYGEMDIVNYESEYENFPYIRGVFYADLIDFDENGVPELVIAYGEGTNEADQYPGYSCQVFAWDGNQALQVNQDDVLVSGGDYAGISLMFAEHDGSQYLLYGEIGAFDHIEFKTWNGSEFITVKRFDNSYFDDYYSYDFMVDNIEVTEEEYTREYNDWMSRSETYAPYGMVNGYTDEDVASMERAKIAITDLKETLGLEDTSVNTQNSNYAYSELIETYGDVINGNTSIEDIGIDMSSSGLWVPPAGSGYIDENGFFVNTNSTSYFYTTYDINNDGLKELIIRDDYSSIVDIFTIHNNQIFLATSGLYRSNIELCEDGVIKRTGHGGAEAQSYEFFRLKEDGTTETLQTAERDWGEYSVDGVECTESELQTVLSNYTVISMDQFDWIQF